MRDRTVYRGDRDPRYATLTARGRDSLFRHRLLQRDGWTCGICGQPIHAQHELDIDHVIPKSRGGADTWGNVRASHSSCNRSRGDGSRDERAAAHYEAVTGRRLHA
jgi:5-methylcytosine-specific restriction endonuclease McrA